ncbi:MAG TPA: amylo-alpha-1,6-glucosidase [Synergistaceae bacterium]|nr:amylo-alpha-1,6-glucosidase [Synergistaceae bacterium]
MYLGKADVNTYDKGAGREYLVSNGRGGYGFSTVIGANTRREHGLLVVRPEGKTQHSVLVSKIEETIFHEKKKYQLSTNRYKDLVYPDGYRYLQEYQGNPFPSMLFVIHSILLKKSIFMPQGKACTIVKYELLAAPDKIRIDLRPLFAHRINSEVCPEPGKGEFDLFYRENSTIGVEGKGHKSYFKATSGTWAAKPLWYENLIYEQDDIPETPSVDHLWSPGYVSNDIAEGDVLYLILSDEPITMSIEEIISFETECSERFENILEQANLPALSSAEQDMIAASYHLIDDRDDPVSPVYTGYPSVEFKARDTFVSLPGLTLATGREKIAARALRIWADICKENDWVMPERIAPDKKCVFEAADNGLWFVYAADKYTKHVGIREEDADIRDAARKITDRYTTGINALDLTCEKNLLLKVDSDDPLRHWMDAVAAGETVVHRRGYLVEVNALWYNALKVSEKFAEADNDIPAKEKYAEMAEKCADSFREIFWNNERKCLYDWIDPAVSAKDTAIRPNQILAASLSYSPLTDDMARGVTRICWDELYTTYGLRTLDPRQDKFKGRSEGRLDQRMKARFRGMAWPWLLGEFISAFLKYNPTRTDLGWIFMRPFNSHLRHRCLGGIAECFDGMMPYKPHGDVLSAMALGELLRVLHENLQFDE